MKNIGTVQFVTDRLFEAISRYSFGDPFRKIVNGFPQFTLIQPVKIDSQNLAIGLNRDFVVSYFFLFDNPDAYKEETNKNHRILTVFAGKVKGLHGKNQTFKNRVYCDVLSRIDAQQNFLHAITVTLKELDNINRKFNIQDFEQEILVSSLKPLDIITEKKEIIFNF
jgi:hypothetical protein